MYTVSHDDSPIESVRSKRRFTHNIQSNLSLMKGGGGLVEFYADLCDVLSSYSIKYDGQTVNDATLVSMFSTKDEEDRKQTLEQSLKQLFYEGNKIMEHEYDRTAPNNVVAHAIPTFQVSNRFFGGRSLPFPSDQEATYSLIRTSLENDPSASIRLSSAYLNLPRSMLSLLTMFGNRNILHNTPMHSIKSADVETFGVPYVLTAGLTSHGFAPKGGRRTKITGIVERIKASIPEAFITLVKDAALSITASGGKLLIYERSGWTFHAKGVWITSHSNADECSERDNTFDVNNRELISDTSSLVSTIIGSSNYGARSYDLDVESNCILIFSESSNINEEEMIRNGDSVKDFVVAEWNDLCKYCSELKHSDRDSNSSNIQQVIVQLMKRFL